jgi:hypothetical protein
MWQVVLVPPHSHALRGVRDAERWNKATRLKPDLHAAINKVVHFLLKEEI